MDLPSMKVIISCEMKTKDKVSSFMLPHMPAKMLPCIWWDLVRYSYWGCKSSAPRTPRDLGTFGLRVARMAPSRGSIWPNATWLLTSTGYLNRNASGMQVNKNDTEGRHSKTRFTSVLPAGGFYEKQFDLLLLLSHKLLSSSREQVDRCYWLDESEAEDATLIFYQL